MECLISYYFFSHTLKESKRKSYVITIQIIGYFILFMFTIFHNILLNLVLFVCINLFIAKSSYTSTLKSAIFYSFILTILMATTELIAEFIPHAFFHKYDAPALDNYTMLVCFIISKTLYFITVFAITKRTNNSYHIQTNIHLIIIILLSLILIFSMTYIAIRVNLDTVSENILVMCTSIILFIIMIVLWLQEYIESKQLELFQTNYDLQQARNYQKYFQLVKEQDKSQKILIHDFKNHLNIISKLCMENKAIDAYQYIEQLIDSPSLFQTTKFTNCNNLNLILTLYQSKCKQLNIAYNVDIQGADISFIQASDLTSLFCNLLDNAVTAAQAIPNSFISIIIRQKNDNAYTISIANSCLKEPKANANGELSTSKSDVKNHGLGIYSMQNVIKKYNGHMHFYYSKSELIFHTIILIYNARNEG